jgi:hypothetical protein
VARGGDVHGTTVDGATALWVAAGETLFMLLSSGGDSKCVILNPKPRFCFGLKTNSGTWVAAQADSPLARLRSWRAPRCGVRAAGCGGCSLRTQQQGRECGGGGG